MQLTLRFQNPLLQLFLIATILYGCQQNVEQETKKPNIIIILADDMGYSDIGCYGSEINTPNIDALAEGGIRFTRFYNTGRCSPSRASLLTGLYPHQAGVGYLTSSWAEHHRQALGAPGYTDHLTKNSVAIAEALKPAGYKTYLSGKWHVGQQKPHWPYYRGFDQSMVLLEGYNYFDPTQVDFARNDQEFHPDPENFYATDYFTNTAVEYVDQHTGDEPFFLYLAYTAPHSPIHAPEEAIARYEGTFMEGWDALRQKRYERMKAQGIISEEDPLSPRQEKIPAWDSLSPEEQKTWDRRMAVYAAQISIMDEGIGKVIEKLKEKGELENTLILFLSDNGGASEPRDRSEPGAKIGSPESWQSYGAWSNVSNTPFRLFKRYIHEGGIATPLIAHWPAGITRKPDDLVRRSSHLIDIMSTCLEVAGISYPTAYNGNEITPTPGKSLAPFFKGKDEMNRKPIFWEHEGNRGVIDGEWKLVSRCGQDWELYNIEKDRIELNNLADTNPDKAQELTQKWQTWADNAGVVSWTTSGKCAKIPDYRKGYEEE